MTIIQNLIIHFFIGFISYFLIMNLILKGYFGNSFKLKISSQLKTNKFVLVKNLIIIYSIINIMYFLMINTPIYLESSTVVNVNLENAKVTVSGEYINKVFENSGSAAAFIAGLRISAAILTKVNMTPMSKMAFITGSGAGTMLSFKMTNDNYSFIKGTFSALKNASNLSVEVKNVEIITSNNNLSSSQNTNLIPRMELKSNETFFSKYQDMFSEKFTVTESPTKDSRVIESLENFTNKKLNEIFLHGDTKVTDNLIDIKQNFINSPLEQMDLVTNTFRDQMINILTMDYKLHFIMIYFVCMLIFLFTIKLLVDKNVSFEFIKSYPLGKYIHVIISKIITLYSKSIIFWIYYLLIFLLIFLCVSTFSLYGCLIALQSNIKF